MNPTLQLSLIISLTLIISLQLTYILGIHGAVSSLFTTSTYFTAIFAILFIAALSLVYKISSIRKEQNRFRSHSIITPMDYEKMVFENTEKQLSHLIVTEDYKRWSEHRKIDKEGEGVGKSPYRSHSKTAHSEN